MSNFKVKNIIGKNMDGSKDSYWVVIDTRTNTTVKTCKKGSDAAHHVRYFEQQLVEAELVWSNF